MQVQLAKVLETRETQLASARAAVEALDPREALLPLLSGRGDASAGGAGDGDAAVVASFLSGYSPLTSLSSSLADLSSQQAALLLDISLLNTSFVSSLGRDPVTVAREEVMQAVEGAVNMFFNLHSKLSAGNTFYVR